MRACWARVGPSGHALNPRGMVFVQSELWSAVSDDGPIDIGAEVEVTSVDGLLLHVPARRSTVVEPTSSRRLARLQGECGRNALLAVFLMRFLRLRPH